MKTDTVYQLLKVGALYFLLLLICKFSATYAKQKGTTAVDESRSLYIGLEKALWDYLDNRNNNQNMQLKKVYDNHRKFVIDNLQSDFNGEKFFILNHYYEWSLLEKDLKDINGLFGYFKTLVNKYANGDYKETEATDFSQSVLKDKTFSIPEIFGKIENVMIKQTLYYRAMMDSKEHLCATSQSAQQFIYSLYNDIALTELKGYTMMQFSWMMLRIYGKGNFTHEASLMREEYEKRTLKAQKLLQEVMKRADKTVWRCDPKNYVKGENYEEITRLLQGYIENEVDMNEYDTCRENCAFYQVAKNHGCFKDLYCARQPRCTGRLFNCQYLDSDMWICPSSLNSTRRYEFIEYENGRVLGKRGSCSRGQTKVDSWWRYLFWHCSYCFCLCDEQGLKSDRYFNLREAKSNTDDNMVVTGLRFKKHKRVIHLQIQEGQLMPRGSINASTLRWKPVEDYNIFDRNMENKIDYHTLSWDQRAIDLDDISGDDSAHVVTGVRFRVVGANLNLEACMSDYNFETGQLIAPKTNSFWKSNDNTELSGERRTPISLKNPDVPIRSFAKSIPTSKHNQFIEFTNSDMDKDAAQSTVPFIDIQEVISNPPVPLSGIGIYHKGRNGFGGFLAPKLITYDFSPYISSPLPSNNDNYH